MVLTVETTSGHRVMSFRQIGIHQNLKDRSHYLQIQLVEECHNGLSLKGAWNYRDVGQKVFRIKKGIEWFV